ncbi:MAG: hypothetical protein KDA67_01570 [Rhodobacteraceae bacterium]|nr:hypothetical protein [Paracoccaceae bacterium]
MKYAILLARQRSGTGALGSVLDKHPQLKYLGEVFHPDNLGQKNNYFTHFLDKVKSDPKAALPDNAYKVFQSFLEDISALHPGKMLIVDIKYRSLHHLDGGWRGVVERPRSITESISHDLPIIHLTRRNALQSFVSGRLAEANKVWHAHSNEQIRVNSAVLNIRQLSNYIVTSEREADLIDRWTKRYKHLESFDYDEMFDIEGHLDSQIAERLAALFGVTSFTDREPTYVKQAPTDMAEAIENYELVKRALLGTDAIWMLD